MVSRKGFDVGEDAEVGEKWREGLPTRHGHPSGEAERSPEWMTLSKLRTGVVGAIAELKAAAWLLGQGFEVYQSVSQHCSADLVVVIDGKPRFVEVRTAHQRKGGTEFSVSRHISRHATTDVVLLAYIVEWDEFRWV